MLELLHGQPELEDLGVPLEDAVRGVDLDEAEPARLLRRQRLQRQVLLGQVGLVGGPALGGRLRRGLLGSGVPDEHEVHLVVGDGGRGAVRLQAALAAAVAVAKVLRFLRLYLVPLEHEFGNKSSSQ